MTTRGAIRGRRRRRSWAALTIACAFALATTAVSDDETAAPAPDSAQNSDAEAPTRRVLVELFTSQG